jgi:hypothetical protein
MSIGTDLSKPTTVRENNTGRLFKKRDGKTETSKRAEKIDFGANGTGQSFQRAGVTARQILPANDLKVHCKLRRNTIIYQAHGHIGDNRFRL